MEVIRAHGLTPKRLARLQWVIAVEETWLRTRCQGGWRTVIVVGVIARAKDIREELHVDLPRIRRRKRFVVEEVCVVEYPWQLVAKPKRVDSSDIEGHCGYQVGARVTNLKQRAEAWQTSQPAHQLEFKLFSCLWVLKISEVIYRISKSTPQWGAQQQVLLSSSCFTKKLKEKYFFWNTLTKNVYRILCCGWSISLTN